MNIRIYIRFVLCFTVLIFVFCSCIKNIENQSNDETINLSDCNTEAVSSSAEDTFPDNITENSQYNTEYNTEAVTSESSHNSDTEPTVTDISLQYPAAIMYHLILDEPYSSETELFVKPEVFDETLRLLSKDGYNYLFADEYFKGNGSKSVVLTFDDGYEDNYTNMFPILKKYSAKATVFLITDLIGSAGYLTEDQIREMSESGLVRFGSHTKTHCSMIEISEDSVRAELSKSKRIIEDLTGCQCSTLAYPGGKYNSSIMKIASDYYEFAYTTKSPNSVHEYTKMNIPRHYGARSLGAGRLLEIIKR